MPEPVPALREIEMTASRSSQSGGGGGGPVTFNTKSDSLHKGNCSSKNRQRGSFPKSELERFGSATPANEEDWPSMMCSSIHLEFPLPPLGLLLIPAVNFISSRLPRGSPGLRTFVDGANA